MTRKSLFWVWTTKSGQKLMLWEMKRPHVQNTLNWVLRKPKVDHTGIPIVPGMNFEAGGIKDGHTYEEWADALFQRLLDVDLF